MTLTVSETPPHIAQLYSVVTPWCLPRMSTSLTGSPVSVPRLTWRWPLKQNGAEERNMATSNNPRKFSEKIALHNQKQAEETAAFEEVMKDLSITRAARVTKPVHVFFATSHLLLFVCFQRAVKYALVARRLHAVRAGEVNNNKRRFLSPLSFPSCNKDQS